MAKAKPETLIFEIFEAISKLTKPKDKLELLKKAYEIDSKIFTTIIKLVFSKDKFYVNEATISKLKPGDKYQSSFKDFLIVAKNLHERKYTGNKQIAYLQDFWRKLDPFHAKWYGRILMKDLRIGVGEALINQVLSTPISHTVPSPMLATSIADISENVLKKVIDNKELYVEIKIDGFRLVSCIYDNHVECYTRNGKRIPYLEEIFFNDFKKVIDSNITKPIILDGEVFSTDWNLTMSFSPARKTKLSEKQEKSLRYFIFDILPGDIKKYKKKDIVKIPLSRRKQTLRNLFKSVHFIQFIYVDHTVISKDVSFDEKEHIIHKLTDKFLKDKWEGSVVKVSDSFYEWGQRSKQWLKVKKFDTLDLLVVDVEPSTKRPNEIAALVVLYKGNKVRVSGLTDELKQKWYTNPKDIIGKIIEVKHMGETKYGKLRHPTFVRVRYDKDKPDA